MNVVVADKRSDRVRSIGHYILAKTIGEGTFGKVKLGTHILTGENVAVKILEKERIVDVADVERVAREIHILKLIRHPHIIQLYEIIETPRQLYLIMEYASGGELFDYIVQHSRVKESEAVKFFHQILVGVEKMHEINVVHRDLKPENLLLDEQKNIKIVDFGLSNTYLPGQLLKTACGSPCYAAPEMIAGHRYVPGLCDMWSCGVILFALLCGYLPFEDPNTSALYRKIMNADYKCPSFVSHNGRDLIRRLLTIDPTKRVTPRSLKNHPWYLGLIRVTNLKDRPPDLQFAGNGCQVPECQKCQREKRSCFIDDEVINQIRELGFPRDYAVQCIQLNKHNHATTTYYLLLAKKTRLKEQLLIDNAIREKFASAIQSVEAETPVERHAPEDTLTAPSSTAPGDDLVQQCATAPHTQQPPKPTRPQSPPTHPNSRSPPPYPPPPPPRQSYLPHPQSAQESSAPPVSRVSPAPQSHMTPPLMLPDMNVESSLRYPAPAIQQQPGIQPAAPQTPLPASSRAVSISDRVQEPLTSRNAMMGRPQIGLNLRQLMSPRATSPIYTALRNTQVTSTPFTPALSARLHDGYRDSTTKCNAHAVASAVGTPRFSLSGHNMTPRTPLPMRLLSQYTPQPRTSMHRQAHAPQADPPRQTSACGETPERTVAVPITARPHAKPVTVPLTARTHTQTAAVPTKLPMSARGPPTASFNQQPIQKYQGVQLASREKYRGAFSFSVMSRKPMKHAIVEVKRALTANRVDFKQTATTAFACQRPSLRFDVHLKEDGPLTYVRLTRISGELWLYNDTCSTLLSHMRL